MTQQWSADSTAKSTLHQKSKKKNVKGSELHILGNQVRVLGSNYAMAKPA